MKSFAWRFFSFLLMILTVVGLVGCGNQAVSNPSPVVLPGLTYTAINPTSIFTPKPDNTFMEATKTPPSEEDDLSAQFTDKGYRLVSSGSLIGPEGFTYSASLFINPDLSPLYGGSDSSQDTMVIAFYRWNGDEKKFLGAQGFPAIGDSYAAGANIVNWDQPIPQKPMVEFLVQADEDTRQMLKQEGYFSDVNQNDLPEFAFVTEYCILSCNDPVGGIQLFEIQNPSTIKNITQDLPGLTFFERHSKDPFTFYVEDRDYYDFYAGITTHWIYTWNGSDFIDVSPQYAEEYLAEANSIISDLESWYGKPFDAEIKLEEGASSVPGCYRHFPLAGHIEFVPVLAANQPGDGTGGCQEK
jgi:hypothetical protein